MTGKRAVDLALRSYPAWWRARYGPELLRLQEDLVHAGRSPARMALGVMLSGVATRCTGTGMPPLPSLWASRSKWLLAASGIPTVVGSFALLVPLSDWWSHQADRVGPVARVATGLWMAALVAFLGLLALALASWRTVLTGLAGTPARRSRLLSAALFLPFAVFLAEIGLEVARSSLGVHLALGPHGVRWVGGVVQHYAVNVPVSDHPAVALLLVVLAHLVGWGGSVLFLAALLAAVGRLPARRELLAGGVWLARWTSAGAAASALLAGLSGALAVRAAPLPGAVVAASLPWWWWPCVTAMLLVAVAGGTGERAARRCLGVAEELRAASA